MTRNATVWQVVDANAPAMSTVQNGRVTKKKRMRRGESLTSPRRIRAVMERQLPALEYRRLGYTYAQIAEALGYGSAQAAYKAVAAALKRVVRAPGEDVFLLELERVDALFVRPYQDALAGDLMALSACLAIMERKCRMLGLDAPVKSEWVHAER